MANKIVDHANKVFNGITCIGMDDSFSGSYKKHRFLCHCGKEFSAKFHDVKTARTKSCGCMPQEKKVKNHAGKVINGITCLRRSLNRKGASFLWHFRCHCGRGFEAVFSSVSGGNIKSCGCKRTRFIDMTGQVFSGIVCEGFVEIRNGQTMFRWRCHCGDRFIANGRSLLRGLTKSCGCKTIAMRREKATVHGMSHTKTHRAWVHMLDRCYRPSDCSFQNYGGRGICVCDRWRESFENFYADMGEPPTDNHSIDRIDNDGPYCKENCRWATRTEQVNNTRVNRLITIHGETKTLAQWCHGSKTKLYRLAGARIRDFGWCDECAITQPKGGRCVHR